MSENALLSLSFLRRHPASAAAALEDMASETSAAYLSEVPLWLLAPVASAMRPNYAAQCLEHAGEDFASMLLPTLSPASAAGILRQLPEKTCTALLERIPATFAFNVKLLLRYPVSTVGAWMEPDVSVLLSGDTVSQALSRLGLESGSVDRFLYLLDRQQQLLGRISLAELLRASANMQLDNLCEPVPFVLKGRSDLQKSIANPAQWRQNDPAPVVARDQRFLGIVRYATLQDVASTADIENKYDPVFSDTLLELLESYWSGLSRLIDGSVNLLPARSPESAGNRAPDTEKTAGKPAQKQQKKESS